MQSSLQADPGQFDQWTAADRDREPAHHAEEAWSRCDFLIESRRPFGLIVGGAGTGKSRLLHRLAQPSPIPGRPDPILIDMTQRDGDSFIRELSERLVVVTSRLDRHERWQLILERLSGFAACELRQVLLLDHLDAALPDAIPTLESLLRAASHSRSLTVLATAREPLSGSLRDLQQDQGWLRIEMTPFNEQQTNQVARGLFRHCGRADHALNHEAVRALFSLTGGNPREVRRLLDLALLAAEVDDADEIDANSLQAIAGELALPRQD